MEYIPVKFLRIGVGMNDQGQVIQVNHVANPRKKIFVIAGKFAQVVMVNQDKTEIIAEVPLGTFGWEYEVL